MGMTEHLPLEPLPQFSFVAVFRERIDYTRCYNLPFNMIAVCAHENAADPSFAEHTETGERFVFHENDVSLTCCGTPLKYRYTAANEHLCIHFRLELFPGVDVFSGIRRRFVIRDDELAAEGKRIFADVSDPVRTLARCQAFALRVCERHWPAHYPYDRDVVAPFEPVLRHVRENANASVDVAALAAMMNRSEGYFTRSFRKAFQVSPKKFLQDALFARAARLLQNPDKTIKAVADELAFSSEFYFSRFFKRMSGVSPRTYREHAKTRTNVIK